MSLCQINIIDLKDILKADGKGIVEKLNFPEDYLQGDVKKLINQLKISEKYGLTHPEENELEFGIFYLKTTFDCLNINISLIVVFSCLRWKFV